MKLVLRSSFVGETLKAKGFDLVKVKNGTTVVEQYLKRLLQKLAKKQLQRHVWRERGACSRNNEETRVDPEGSRESGDQELENQKVLRTLARDFQKRS